MGEAVPGGIILSRVVVVPWYGDVGWQAAMQIVPFRKVNTLSSMWHGHFSLISLPISIPIPLSIPRGCCGQSVSSATATAGSEFQRQDRDFLGTPTSTF